MGVTLSSYLAGRDSDSSQVLRIPMFLFQDDLFADLSIGAKVLYGLMLYQLNDVDRNCGVDEKGNVYIHYTIGEVEKHLHCSKPKAIDIMTELEKFEMIRKVQEGRGKPARIYVMDCFQHMHSELKRSPDKSSLSAPSSYACTKSDNRMESDQDTDWASRRLTVVGNSSPSRCEEEKFAVSRYLGYKEKDPHDQARTDRGNDLTSFNMATLGFSECMGKVHERLEYDLLLERNPMQTRLIDDICDLIVETLLSKKNTIRCAGEDMKTQLVQQRLARLNSMDIERIIKGMREAGTAGKVRNPKNYLLTVLYNEPITSDAQYMMDVNSDLAGVI